MRDIFCSKSIFPVRYLKKKRSNLLFVNTFWKVIFTKVNGRLYKNENKMNYSISKKWEQWYYQKFLKIVFWQHCSKLWLFDLKKTESWLHYITYLFILLKSPFIRANLQSFVHLRNSFISKDPSSYQKFWILIFV